MGKSRSRDETLSGVDDLPALLGDVDRARLVQRFGSGAEAWCAGLPGLVNEVRQAWRLQVEALLPAGSNSVVLSCSSDDGKQVVLKLTPSPPIAAQEAAALRAWSACQHVVALLDHDVERGALLLESVQPGTTLSDDSRGWSLDDVAPMFAELWQPAPAGAGDGLPDLSERVEVIFLLARRRLERLPDLKAQIGRDVVKRSFARSRELAVQGPVGLVHGDLHPGNVLRASDRGVVAIDPRPCRGDRAIDAVDWILSDVVDARGLEKRVDWLALNVPNVDPARVWAWCQALAVIIAVSRLARRKDDLVGRFLLRLASTV